MLPFENVGGDPSWRRLADGLTQDITTDLSQSKDLYVIARNSTEIYRDKAIDIRDVGRELDARYVLEGSIQPGDNRIRITARLIDALSGETVWSTKYSRPVADIFDVQSDVTETIAATLSGYQGAMAQVERKLIRRKPPSELRAYEHYLLGVEAKHWRRIRRRHQGRLGRSRASSFSRPSKSIRGWPEPTSACRMSMSTD